MMMMLGFSCYLSPAFLVALIDIIYRDNKINHDALALSCHSMGWVIWTKLDSGDTTILETHVTNHHQFSGQYYDQTGQCNFYCEMCLVHFGGQF
jgi:hypothetical protein